MEYSGAKKNEWGSSLEPDVEPLPSYNYWVNKASLRTAKREFPGGPVVRTLHFQCREHGFSPWLGNSHKMRGVAKKKKELQR